MNGPQEIPISLVRYSGRAWLSLTGTILTYRQKHAGREQIIDIPVELVSVSGRKRFMGNRLIYALIGLMIGPAAGGAATGFYYALNKSLPDSVLNACLGIGALLGAILSFTLIVWFFHREKTVILEMAKGGGSIEFWTTRHAHPGLEALVGRLGAQSARVNEETPYPLHSGTADYVQNPWRVMMGTTFIFALPGIMTEWPPLLLLALLPPIWYGYRTVLSLKQPAYFRKASQYCYRGHWDKAMTLIEEAVQGQIDHLPSQLMYAELLCRQGRFDEASGALADLQEALETEYLQAFQEEMILRQRIWDRKYGVAA